MPEVVFGVTATRNHNDFISICFSISTREAGAARKRLANLYEAVKGGGRIDRKLAFKYQVGNMCFFIQKCKQGSWVSAEAETPSMCLWRCSWPLGALHMHQIGSLLET